MTVTTSWLYVGMNWLACWHCGQKTPREHGCAGHRPQRQERGVQDELHPLSYTSTCACLCFWVCPTGSVSPDDPANLHPWLRNHWDAHTLAFMEFPRESVVYAHTFVSAFFFLFKILQPIRLLNVLAVWFSLVGNIPWCG